MTEKLAEEALCRLFTKKQWTLSVAESCTGGALAAKITAVPGCSAYFLGSVVAYSNTMKSALLGVQASTLDRHGAVSQAVVLEMAAGVLRLTNSDFSLAVSGIAGPSGGVPLKPVGTVWCALARKNGASISWLLQLKGSRCEIVGEAVNSLIEALLYDAQQGSK